MWQALEDGASTTCATSSHATYTDLMQQGCAWLPRGVTRHHMGGATLAPLHPYKPTAPHPSVRPPNLHPRFPPSPNTKASFSTSPTCGLDIIKTFQTGWECFQAKALVHIASLLL